MYFAIQHYYGLYFTGNLEGCAEPDSAIHFSTRSEAEDAVRSAGLQEVCVVCVPDKDKPAESIALKTGVTVHYEPKTDGMIHVYAHREGMFLESEGKYKWSICHSASTQQERFADLLASERAYEAHCIAHGCIE